MDGRETAAGCRNLESAITLSPAMILPENATRVFRIMLQATAGNFSPKKRRTGPMARITLRQLLDHAAEHDYGVPAFNINNMEQALSIMEAASSLDAPVIIQASRGARSYANDVMLRHMM